MNLIDATKKASDIVDPNKYKKYIEFLEEAKTKEIEQIHNDHKKEMGDKFENL